MHLRGLLLGVTCIHDQSVASVQSLPAPRFRAAISFPHSSFYGRHWQDIVLRDVRGQYVVREPDFRSTAFTADWTGNHLDTQREFQTSFLKGGDKFLRQWRRCGVLPVMSRPSTITRGCPEKYRQPLLQAQLLEVGGRLQHEKGVMHIIAEDMVDRSAWLGSLRAPARDFR